MQGGRGRRPGRALRTCTRAPFAPAHKRPHANQTRKHDFAETGLEIARHDPICLGTGMVPGTAKQGQDNGRHSQDRNERRHG